VDGRPRGRWSAGSFWEESETLPQHAAVRDATDGRLFEFRGCLYAARSTPGGGIRLVYHLFSRLRRKKGNRNKNMENPQGNQPPTSFDHTIVLEKNRK
jgi:hypothetical protein